MHATTHATTHRVETTPDPRPWTQRICWDSEARWVTPHRRHVALCRETVDGWVLQHVRTVTVSQRAPSRCEIDTAPALEDLPDSVRASLPDGIRGVTDGV